VAIGLFVSCAAAQLRPLAAPVVAIAGEPLVVAVAPSSPADLSPPAARLDDSTMLSAELIPVAFRAAPPSRDWVAPAPVPVVRDGRALDATWLLVVDMPRAAAGQGLWINGRRWELRWLPDPLREAASLGIDTKAEDPLENPFAGPVAPAVRADKTLRALAEPAAVSPLSRWRWRLLSAGLRPVDTLGPPPPTVPPDTVLSRLVARDTAARWRRALLTLFNADPALSVSVRRALAGAAAFPAAGAGAGAGTGGGAGAGAYRVAPLWWPEQGLLDDLLRAPSPRQTRERAAAWLDTVPPAVFRVRDAGAGFVVDRTELEAELVTREGGLAEFRAGGESELRVTEPGRVERATLAVGRGDAGIAAVGDGFEIVRRRVPPLRPTPPGVVLGPLLAEPTMAEWRDDAPAVPDTSIRVLLQRGPGPAGRWQVHVRVAEPPTGTGSVVRVHLGAPGAPRAVVFDRAGAAERTGRGWADVAELPIDADAQRVALAVVRTRPSGARSSWPLPMLPWDDAPGHAPVELGAWRGRGVR